MQVVVGSRKEILTQKNFIASGGQANVWKKGDRAFKIYMDSQKKNPDPKAMIPVPKIQELEKIQHDHILRPLDIIYDKKSKAIGYTMSFVDSSHPLCKLFTKSFKKRNNLGPSEITDIVKVMQDMILEVHKASCVIADLNEMNVLIGKDFKSAYFIDVDSYQTPSYKATAIMESVRDRTLPFGTFNRLSDWFSFAVLAFQLYINIHPYRGSHPKYKNNDWQKRMDDGVSVFDKNVGLPPVCNSFSVIPKNYLDWMKAVFIKGERSIPPIPGAISPVTVPVTVPESLVVVIQSKGDFEVKKIHSYKDNILDIFNLFGVGYVITQKSIYRGAKEIDTTVDQWDKVLLCESGDMNPVVCRMKNEEVTFSTFNGDELAKTQTKNMFHRNGAIYTLHGSSFQQHTFKALGDKVYKQTKVVGQASELSSFMFDGGVYQDLLGKPWFQIPYDQDKCFFQNISELEGYRVVDARAEGNYLIVLGSKKGIYDRMVFVFDKNFSNYTLRITEDVGNDSINFTVLQNGTCLLAMGSSNIELFLDNTTIKSIPNAPFDSSMKLHATSSGVYVADDNIIYSASMIKKAK